MSTDTVWKQALTASGSGTDAPQWTLGLTASAYGDIGSCTVSAIWWSPPAGATGTVGWRIYSGHVGEAHSLLASGNLPSYTAAGGWQRFAITPQDVSGINFMVCLYTSSHGDYAFKSSPGFPVDDGVLVSTESSFKEAADAAPDQHSALSYMIDFELTYGGGGATLDADSALTATGTSTSTAAVDRAANSASSSTATIASTANVSRAADAALAVTATLAATAAVSRVANVARTATATISATASVVSGTQRDIAVTFGQPRTRWSTASPHSRWSMSSPRS